MPDRGTQLFVRNGFGELCRLDAADRPNPAAALVAQGPSRDDAVCQNKAHITHTLIESRLGLYPCSPLQALHQTTSLFAVPERIHPIPVQMIRRDEATSVESGANGSPELLIIQIGREIFINSVRIQKRRPIDRP